MTDPKTTDGNAPWQRRQWFGDTVIRLLDRLYGTARRLTGDRTRAEDLVTEAVARAWAGLEAPLQDTSRLEDRLLHVLSSTFIRDLRQRRRHDAAGADGEARPGDGDAPERCPPPRQRHGSFPTGWGAQRDRLVDSLHWDDVARAVDALPEDERVVVVLVEMQGYRRTEAAEMLQAPAGAVQAQLDRGRARLREALRRLADDTAGPGPASP
ncbi:RNA polymerase sigma factor [Aquisalimonas lutea]|uniref:RNA polymerase sigma factor n=1 Tax=Aquisalimonas lutea TaxID=1327750 RepID=UPI0025B37C5F|nr:RNA polymerase sigma factor [Aquisalimonas lutea]MDN3519413.1 RNA polymerase sigma factor [Aquisalimonas lutea]